MYVDLVDFWWGMPRHFVPKSPIRGIIQETIIYCESRSKSVVLYFYFDFNDIEKQLHEQIIRSLISQLFMHCATVPSVLDMLYSSCMDGERQPSVENLLTTLHQMMTAFEETYIILDALDECGDRPELFRDLQDVFAWKDVNCRMLVISRREKDIEDGLMSSIKQARALCIHSALIDADIRQYIHDRLQSDRKLKKWQKEQFEIEDALMHRANGMYAGQMSKSPIRTRTDPLAGFDGPHVSWTHYAPAAVFFSFVKLYGHCQKRWTRHTIGFLARSMEKTINSLSKYCDG